MEIGNEARREKDNEEEKATKMKNVVSTALGIPD